MTTRQLHPTPGLDGDGWSLEGRSPVPSPAAPDSKEPAAPEAFAEEKLAFAIAPSPFEPDWDSVRQQYPGVPVWP